MSKTVFLTICFISGIILILIDICFRFLNQEILAQICGQFGGSLIGSVIGIKFAEFLVEKNVF